MEFRNLGRTGVQVSALCLGTMMFGRRTEPDESYEIIDRAIDRGVNFIDTANIYGRGRSEEITGEALKRNGQRSRIVLATKVHGRMADDDPNALHNSRRHIVEQCHASLRRLQTDYIDLYQLHRPSPHVPIDETLRALDDLIRDGKVRYIGTSNFGAWRVVEALWVSKELGLNRFVCGQPAYNILDRRAEREELPMARTFGIGIITWSPLAAGLLTGKYRRGQTPAADTRYGGDVALQKRRMTPGVFDAVEKLEPLAPERGVELSQLVVAWLMAQPGVTAPIIGPRTKQHLESYLGALDVRITSDDCERIDAVVPPGMMVSPYHEAGSGPHPEGCCGWPRL